MSTPNKNISESNHKNPVGRPLLFKTPQLLQEAIDSYFDKPPQVKRIWGKDGESYEDLPIYTVSGLAYHLGFNSRQTLYNYTDRPEFLDITKRAILFIECEYERAMRENNVAGVIFALKNMGCRDKQDIEHSGTFTFADMAKKAIQRDKGESDGKRQED